MLTRSLFVLIGCLLPAWGYAADAFRIAIAEWTLDEVVAQQFAVSVDMVDQGLVLRLSADRIQLAPPVGTLRNVTLVCKPLRILSARLDCPQGELAFTHKALGQQHIFFTVDARPALQQYRITLKQITLAAGDFSGLLTLKKQHWQLRLSSQHVLLNQIRNSVMPYLTAPQQVLLRDWDVAGKVAVKLSVAGQQQTVNKVGITLNAAALNVSEPSGKYVAEEVGLTLKVQGSYQQKNWHWNSHAAFHQGQAYADPVYLDFSQTPIQLTAQGRYQESNHGYQVNSFALKQGRDIQLTGSLEGHGHRLTSGQINIEKTAVDTLYQTWIQPFVVGTVLDNLALSGEIALQAGFKGQHYTVTADLTQLYLHQAEALFSMDDINGTVAWTNTAESVPFSLKWRGGSLYAIPIGSSTLKARVSDATLHLTAPWKVPVLDGQLDIPQFELYYDPPKPLRWHFSGQLSPISMEKLSATLGWPLLHGKLAGTIPDVRYQAHQITVDGVLKVNLFGGNTLIQDLKLERPFGVLPQLQANVVLKEIDLETLTRTFDFGEITGKLNGEIRDLRLSNWKAVQFDAAFATPEGDRSRHRISQQAVNNLSQIGGGAAGVLQRSFLRFFENFSYQRLGLSCKLRNEVCEMSGVGEAKQGYYIVKGGGLPPRIDVIGYTRRVDWPELIARLQAVSQSEGPVVE